MLWLIKRLIVLALLLTLTVPTVLFVVGLQPEPLVPLGSAPTPADVARAKTLIKRLDPRGQPAGEPRSLEVRKQDLAFALDYAVGRLLTAGAAVDLRSGGATVTLSVQVPQNPLGRFFNMGVDLIQVPGGVEIDGLRFGTIELPQPIANAVGRLVREVVLHDETMRALLGSVNGYRVTEDRLVLLYQWQPDLVDLVKSKGRALLVDPADRERLLAYSACIAVATREAASAAGKTPLTELLAPVFDEARARTGVRGDAAAENRAAIVAMMLYVQGVDVPRLLDEPGDARYRGKARSLTLRGRRDLAQHFLISAGIAAAGGSRLADAVGLFKELNDSRSGSGFSFSDLAADRAGVRFAETAAGPTAGRVQTLMADRPRESLFMPDLRGLPEFMPEAEFARRFGGVGRPAYQHVADDIESRIAALDIHRAGR